MPAARRRAQPAAPSHGALVVQRVQTGVRIEKSLLRVLRALAAWHDMSLGDLLEGIVLHAFEGKPAFGREGLARIAELKRIYGLQFDASHSHRLVEHGAVVEEGVPEPARKRPHRRRA